MGRRGCKRIMPWFFSCREVKAIFEDASTGIRMNKINLITDLAQELLYIYLLRRRMDQRGMSLTTLVEYPFILLPLHFSSS
jgi:hypothetical protein